MRPRPPPRVLDRYRPALIGAGKIARVFVADLLAAGLDVSAVAARDPDRAARFAHETGIPVSYGSYEELVRDPDMDVVYVATPQPFHAEQAILAIEAGKAVLVEKSFGVWQSIVIFGLHWVFAPILTQELSTTGHSILLATVFPACRREPDGVGRRVLEAGARTTRRRPEGPRRPAAEPRWRVSPSGASRRWKSRTPGRTGLR